MGCDLKVLLLSWQAALNMARLDKALRVSGGASEKIVMGLRYCRPLRLGLTSPCWGLSYESDRSGATVEEVALTKIGQPPTLLEEGAKKEGKLLWYTTLIVNQALKPIKEAFEKKYPYVQVEYHRADSEALAQRHAGRVSGQALRRRRARRHFDHRHAQEGRLHSALYSTPQLREYPARLKEPSGLLVGAQRLFHDPRLQHQAGRSRMKCRSRLNDLLNPKWQGKMVWNTSGGSGAPLFLGNTLITLGEAEGHGLSETAGDPERRQEHRQRAGGAWTW